MTEELLLDPKSLGAEVELGILQAIATLSAKSPVTIRNHLESRKEEPSNIALATWQEPRCISDTRLAVQLTSQTSQLQH